MAGKAKVKVDDATAVPEVPNRVPLGLTDIRPAKGAVKKSLRVGRGRASGAGKTANRGHNGEGQRSGRSSKRGFEGGQMPGFRQMPKINGFRLVNQRNWLAINLMDLPKYLAGGTTLDEATLREQGWLRQTHDGIRLLGNGDAIKKLTVRVHHVSASAREKIEAAGGTITLIGLATKAVA
jgi:large subunit ribosomal protein L15